MVGYVGRSDPIHVQAFEIDPAELAKIIFSLVQEVEPDNVSKIVGCILLREPDEDELLLAWVYCRSLTTAETDAQRSTRTGRTPRRSRLPLSSPSRRR